MGTKIGTPQKTQKSKGCKTSLFHLDKNNIKKITFSVSLFSIESI